MSEVSKPDEKTQDEPMTRHVLNGAKREFRQTPLRASYHFVMLLGVLVAAFLAIRPWLWEWGGAILHWTSWGLTIIAYVWGISLCARFRDKRHAFHLLTWFALVGLSSAIMPNVAKPTVSQRNLVTVPAAAESAEEASHFSHLDRLVPRIVYVYAPIFAMLLLIPKLGSDDKHISRASITNAALQAETHKTGEPIG